MSWFTTCFSVAALGLVLTSLPPLSARTVAVEAVAAGWTLPSVEAGPAGRPVLGPEAPLLLRSATLAVGGQIRGELPRTIEIDSAQSATVTCPGFQSWRGQIRADQDTVMIELQPKPETAQWFSGVQSALQTLREQPSAAGLEAVRKVAQELKQKRWQRRSSGLRAAGGPPPIIP